MFASEAASSMSPARLDGFCARMVSGTVSGKSMDAMGPAAYMAA